MILSLSLSLSLSVLKKGKEDEATLNEIGRLKHPFQKRILSNKDTLIFASVVEIFSHELHESHRGAQANCLYVITTTISAIVGFGTTPLRTVKAILHS